TGSGLGTFVLNLLEDEFPEVYRFVTSVYPSGEDDVITSPYNSVLAMKELNEHADCVLPIENESLFDIVNKIHQMTNSGKLGSTVRQNSLLTSSAGATKTVQEKPFDAMNNIVANLLLNLTRLKPSLHFVSWNQEGWKTTLCSVPPVGHSHSLLALANNTCVKPTFMELKDRFMKLYKKKAHLHHYMQVDGMEQSCFSEAISSLSDLIEEYNKLDATKGGLRTDASRLKIAV
ncbi:UNVERIFIED_CONTAM: hypothetical protein H355_007697, partial [Colinus virginianus]